MHTYNIKNLCVVGQLLSFCKSSKHMLQLLMCCIIMCNCHLHDDTLKLLSAADDEGLIAKMSKVTSVHVSNCLVYETMLVLKVLFIK